MKTWRPGRCKLCGKKKDHENHRTVARVGLLHRLTHLAWPRWTWDKKVTHEFVVDRSDRVAKASHEMVELRRSIDRRKRIQPW